MELARKRKRTKERLGLRNVLETDRVLAPRVCTLANLNLMIFLFCDFYYFFEFYSFVLDSINRVNFAISE